MMQKISGYFFRGLITLLPLLITLMVGKPVPGLGLLFTIILIFVVGFFATYIIGAQLFKYGEELLYRVPIVKSIYSGVKQINDLLFHQKSAEEYRRACMVEYPRKGVWSVGFVTSDATEEIETKAKEKMLNVFIPNTPTPATGFLIIVPAREVTLLDMKIEEAFKYVLSGGVLQPKDIIQETLAKKEG